MLKNIEPKVKTGLAKSRSSGNLNSKNFARSSGSKGNMMMQQELQRKNNFSCNEDLFNKVTRLTDNGADFKYNNSRLEEELDINLDQGVRNNIKNNVEFRYTDLENLLTLNLNDKKTEAVVAKPP